MEKVQRYTWSDALVQAQAMGVIGNGELLTGMKLALAINWCPKGNKPAGLYWENELAADVCGVSRATFYRTIKGLKEAGFLVLEKGNLLPVIPESQVETEAAFIIRREGLVEAFNTSKSQNETSKSQTETQKSQSDNPFSVDVCSVDSFSSAVVPPAASPLILSQGDVAVVVETSSLIEQEPGLPLSKDEEVAKSQIETLEEVEEDPAAEGVSLLEAMMEEAGLPATTNNLRAVLRNINKHGMTPEASIAFEMDVW